MSLLLEHLAWKWVCTGAILVSVQYSVCISLYLFKMTKYTPKIQEKEGMTSLHKYFEINRGRGLSAESGGLWNCLDGGWPRTRTRSPCSRRVLYALALMISMNSGLREAPPTRKPSTSFWAASSLQVAPVTEPEEKNRFMSSFVGTEGTIQKSSSCHWLTSVDDPHRVAYILRHVGLQPAPQFIMNLLSLRSHSKDTTSYEYRNFLVFHHL